MNKSFKFMVVDDNHTNNILCKFTIRKFAEDAEITIFSEPEIAIRFIEEEYLNNSAINKTILFLDINMPTITGWEFLEVFKNFNEGIHKQFIIYMLTSSIDKRDRNTAEANPFVSGFFSKPLTIENINQVVKDQDLMISRN